MNTLIARHRAVTRIAVPCLLALAALVGPGVATADAATAPRAKSDCASGYFCVWTGTNYTGTIQRISATNAYRAVTLSTTRSYYNHRSKRTWLHQALDGSGSHVCINPGVSKASTSGWQATANAVYLATIANC